MKQLRQLKQMMALVRLCSKRYLPMALGESLLSILNSLAKLLLPAVFIGVLMGGTGGRLAAVVGMALVIFMLDRSYALCKRKMDDERVQLNQKLELLLAEKMLTVEYALLDDPEFLDLKSGASFAVSSHKAVQNALGYLTQIINTLILVLSGAVYLVAANPLLLVLLLLGMVGQTWLAGRLNGKLAGFFQNLYAINRKFDWFSSLKTNLTYQKDIRLFKMEQMILDKTEAYNCQTTALFGAMNDATFRSTFGVTAIHTLTLALCFLVSGMSAARQLSVPSVAMSQFVLYLSLTGSLSSALSGFADDLTSAFQMFGYLEPVVTLMKYPDKRPWGTLPLETLKTIQLKYVSFCYPGTDAYALKDVSLTIEQGERLALVGLNGSGKTTLVKLLCGLYDATEGQILINGQPIRAYDRDSYLKNLAVVLQDFQIYDYTVAENIAMVTPADRVRVDTVIEEANLRTVIDPLHKGADTVLSVQLSAEGVSLSGGEKQRLAIARALYKYASAYIFDEPASSLDPVAEYQAYLQYDKMTAGKTCIYISHRMATTRFCDQVAVLSEGALKELGTHEQLLNTAGSLYANLYQHQRDRL